MAKKHWIYIKRGLSEDPKHRAAMGECIWLFMHIIDRADWETGIAIDWKDEAEAADMSMPVTTLRHQRRKLEELDYIRSKQRQRSQDIHIMEWINPRNYSSEVKNPRNQGDNELTPSEIQGDNYGDNAGDNHPGSGVNTPSSTPKSKSGTDKNLPPDFKNMTVGEARKFPTIKLYMDATEQFPGSVLWETVHKTITENNLTLERLRAAAVAWIGRGYRPENVQGILEWAVNGIPANGKSVGSSDQKPAINEAAVERTKQYNEDRWNFKPAPPPPDLVRPIIKTPERKPRR
jgi:hypothetical protein